MLSFAMPSAPPTLPHVTVPTTLVIFGATGALAQRKLMPTLLKLKRQGLLPNDFKMIGISRQNLSDDLFQAQLVEAIRTHFEADFDAQSCDALVKAARHLTADVRGGSFTADLARAIGGPAKGAHHVIYYLATAPSLFAPIATALGEAGLAAQRKGGRTSSIVVEKPFGHDLASARKLNQTLTGYFSEEQIYRMDHYLGKDTVQNILAFRFENGLFEPIWNCHYIDHVQITLAEDAGIGSRGQYYEESGALRDVVQNHLLQLLANIALEPPADLSADQLRERRAQVLARLRPLQPSELRDRVVRGQYGSGQDLAGRSLKGYLDEEFVGSSSTTETFVALPVELLTERWMGVPFYLRAGKRLPKPVTEITVQFKPSAHDLYHKQGLETANLLTFRIQPNEGIALRLLVKEPGYEPRLEQVDMSFCYRDAFASALPEAYDRLLLDVLLEDQSLYPRADEIESSWKFIDPVLAHWGSHRPPEFPNYQAGTWGPRAADELIAADGRQWWSDRLDVCPVPGAGQASVRQMSNQRAGRNARP